VGFVFVDVPEEWKKERENVMAQELFPAFVKLTGRRCLVVGAGRVAESKIESLERCGADVKVVAPKATPAVQEMARTWRVAWEQREFVPADLDGMFLVVAATSSAVLHEEVFARARKLGILCNAVDEPERCDFYYPAVVRRGPLQIAVSTGGQAPLLAQQIRRQLEGQFGEEYGPWTEKIGRARRELLAQDKAPQERLERLKELCGPESLADFRRRGDAASPEGKDAQGKVYFVGAGPGDPDLLTRKAWTVLQQAEVVLHDALVSPDILRLVPRAALVIDVGKRCGKKSIAQQEIHARMIEQAYMGRTVVRLQGGDPLVFGRAGEEMAALRAAGVEFEIVPGVTAASAAGAAAKAPLTRRGVASKLVFLSAHRCAGEFVADWKPVVARDATCAIYMPGGSYERIARELMDAGLSTATPCVIVSQASTAHQIMLRLDLASLVTTPEAPAPAVLLVGEVLRAAVAGLATVSSADGESVAVAQAAL
jgi:uroporphyrin-III C-methyltransferase/precorrin-2 dehydrogenase/sirohydrochlorin ferrochelatase